MNAHQRLLRSLAASPRLSEWAAATRVLDGRPFDLRGHRYLRKIYDDTQPLLVIRKAAQMGASEYAISRALHFCITHGGTCIYYFPTDNDVGEFSRARFGPAVRASRYFSALVRDTDTAGYKQIGPKGAIYFRGTNSRIRMKSVPADFLVFDEVNEMLPASVELARKRLGHSKWGWELEVSTPSLPEYGIDAAYLATDQQSYLLACPGCGGYHCLEDEFLEHHGDPADPRTEICFVKGEPGRETLVCLGCGHALDPADGRWVARYPSRPRRGYHVTKFISSVVSQAEKSDGCHTKPAALLKLWRETKFPGEFFNSELGLPYLGAEGGLTEAELLALAGKYGRPPKGKACVMGVDQGNGLHVVIKEPHDDRGIVLTILVHHEPQTDPTFSHLDHLMETYDVRYCVIDALPNTHAARAFAKRFPGRVWCAYYGGTQKGAATWGFDAESTRMVTVNRTEALDAWRDAYKLKKRRIPRVEDEVTEYVRQMTTVLRKIEEDRETGQKKAVWVQRGPDHFAHADSYAEIALRRQSLGLVRGSLLG